MTHEEIVRMAADSGCGWAQNGTEPVLMGEEQITRFAALVAAAKQEQIARQWDALHEQYMADPLRRQMMLSYEMVAKMIRGRT